MELPAPSNIQPEYGPLVPTCNAHGIGRTTAFQLAREGLIDTFTIGRKRFVRIESLRTLPERIKAREGASE